MLHSESLRSWRPAAGQTTGSDQDWLLGVALPQLRIRSLEGEVAKGWLGVVAALVPSLDEDRLRKQVPDQLPFHLKGWWQLVLSSWLLKLDLSSWLLFLCKHTRTNVGR